jgi:hypothetical protein
VVPLHDASRLSVALHVTPQPLQFVTVFVRVSQPFVSGAAASQSE